MPTRDLNERCSDGQRVLEEAWKMQKQIALNGNGIDSGASTNLEYANGTLFKCIYSYNKR